MFSIIFFQKVTFVEVWVPSIDISQLYSDDVLDHVVGRNQSASQQVGHHVYNLLVKFWEPAISLVDWSSQH